MKIIHTADIHLDSPLVGVADSITRRAELLRALSAMSKFADNVGVAAVIVAGDLFDDKFVSNKTVASVAKIIGESKARWFVLRGNHGDDTPYRALSKQCGNVSFFGDDWTSYNLDNVTICGRELGSNDAAHWQCLALDPARYNVLVLHGDVDDPSYGEIDKKAIAAQPVQYVALGHRHAFCEHKFGHVRGAYSGVLETRGFDELTSAGFVLLDTDSNKAEFISHPIRRVETVSIDVSDVDTDLELERAIDDSVAKVSANNYLNVVFCGALDGGVRLDAVADRQLKNRFFALRIQNKTVPRYDLQQLSKEVSLRGEFVKLALDIPDETERNEVLRLGLLALSGEELA